MGVASWSFVVWAAVWVWAGRGCSSRKAGWLVLWFPACVVGAGVVGLSGAGIGDTPALVGCCGCCGRGGRLVVGAPACLVCVGVACCRGSGAVRPGCLARLGLLVVGVLGGCGWVGCELYSGREHLTVRFLRQMFLFCSCVFVVCFFERSVDALASGADEGRGGLRYSSGSRLAGCDPRVSEWGDPARVMSCHLHLNCIGCGG